MSGSNVPMVDRDTLKTLAAVLMLAVCWLIAGLAALPVVVDAWNMPGYRHASDIGQPRGVVIQQTEGRSMLVRGLYNQEGNR